MLVGAPLPGKVATLGMVTHAECAHLGAAAATAGSTIYDGDQLSTEAEGALRINCPNLALHLEEQPVLTLRHPASAQDTAEADLGSGTLDFSAARNDNISVVADDALIRPPANAATITHIRVVNLRELRIYAQRGSWSFLSMAKVKS